MTAPHASFARGDAGGALWRGRVELAVGQAPAPLSSGLASIAWPLIGDAPARAPGAGEGDALERMRLLNVAACFGSASALIQRSARERRR